jgi:hypothetical protein
MTQEGIFLAAGAQGARLTSHDGTRWSKPQLSEDPGGEFRGLAVGKGRAVAVGPYGRNATIFSHTADGQWSKVEKKEGDDLHLNDIAFGAGRFVAVGGSIPNYIKGCWMTSMDGTEWSEAKLKHRKQGGFGFLRVAFGGGRFVAIGRAAKIAVSNDGATWDFHDNKDANVEDTFINLTYGNGVFVGTGLHGMRMTSPDGINWSNKQTGREGEHINTILWTGEQFVGVAPGGTYFSPDGMQWRREDNHNAPLIFTHGNDRYVGARYKGELLVSDDAIRWRQVAKVDFDLRAFTFLRNSG